jgi:hypothetical protein
LVVGGGKRTLDDFFPAKKAQDARWEVVTANMGRAALATITT